MTAVPPSSSPAARSSKWHPSPAIWASAALHGGAAVATLVNPPVWPWAVGAVVANHLGLTAAGLWPKSCLLGPNITRLSSHAAQQQNISISFDDGPNPAITPWVLDELDRHGAKATFFCVGARVREHAALAREIVARGHVIENHSDLHSHAFSFFGLSKLARDIDAAQKTIADATGRVPQLFRAPAGLRSPLLEPVLARTGLALCAWTRRGFDTVERDPARVLARLTDGLAAGDILLLHDGNAAVTVGGNPVIREVLPPLLARIHAGGLKLVTIHNHIQQQHALP
jgi:peptidoglycan-N-acetylglucosamine deacetylase